MSSPLADFTGFEKHVNVRALTSTELSSAFVYLTVPWWRPWSVAPTILHPKGVLTAYGSLRSAPITDSTGISASELS